jgi:TonB family protein
MMELADLVQALYAGTFASSVAVMLVLLLRRPLRAAFGAGVAYAAWALVPVAAIAVFLPAATHPALTMPMMQVLAGDPVGMPIMPAATAIDWSLGVGPIWIAGMLVAAMYFARQQRVFGNGLGTLQPRADGFHQAQALDGLPAALGLWKPIIVLPADFDTRYPGEQRALMIAHERLHILHGDLHANAVATGLRCVFWFNPLLHFASRCFRHDQELACDQRVIARHPHARRAYGEAMFRTQVARHALPLGCHWGSHPLKERIAMLKQPLPSSLRWIAGSALVVTLTLGTGLAAWAMQPAASPAGRTVSVDIKNASLLDAARQVAAKAGLRLANPEVLQSRQRLTLQLVDEPLDEVLSSLGKAVGRVPQVSDGEVWFAKPAPQVVSDARMPAPAYPAKALQQGIDGHVVLRIDVGADGRPAHVEVASAEPAGVFDQAAVDAAKHWTFEPKRKNGKAFAYQVEVPVKFVSEAPPHR